MSRFLSNLLLEDATNDDDGRWIVARELIYESDIANCTIIVPAGFQTDLASVPRLPVVYLFMGDRAHRAAVIHDWIYSQGLFSRKLADAVFREASAATGVNSVVRWLMWAGVRIGGSSHYKQDDSKTA